MRVVILYHPESDHARSVTEFANEYKARNPLRELELLSVDTKDGANLAQVYDITRYPSVLAISNDGALQKMWSDENLPLINEVSYYQLET